MGKLHQVHWLAPDHSWPFIYFDRQLYYDKRNVNHDDLIERLYDQGVTTYDHLVDLDEGVVMGRIKGKDFMLYHNSPPTEDLLAQLKMNFG